MFRRVERFIDRAAGVVTGLLLIAIVAVLLLQVIGRHVLQYPFPWPEEVAGFLFVWLIFLGAIRAHRHGSLMGIDWLVDKFSPPTRGMVKLLSDFVVIALLVGLVWTGIEATLAAGGSVTTMLRFSWGWVYVSFPVGCAALLLAFLSAFIRDTARLRRSFRNGSSAADQDQQP